MNRLLFAGLVSLVVFVSGQPLRAQSITNHIVAQREAARYGLTRAWFTQIQLDRSRHRVVAATLHGKTLFVQTNGAVVHAIDTESGRTLWAHMIGKARNPSMAAAANDKYVAVINGLKLFLLDRERGRPIWNRRVGGVAGAGPALTETHVYVPMINGRMEAYELEDERQPPWIFQSSGRALTQPTVTKDSVAWPTDRGHMYVSRTNNPGLRFRFEAFDTMSAAPAYKRPYLICAGFDGYVNAVHERNGDVLWDFSTGDPISQPPVVIGNNVYVIPQTEGIFCISSRSGQRRWWTPGAKTFLAGSKKRVYVTDRLRRMMILDVKTGGRIDTMSTHGADFLVTNRQTDRIFLGTKTGVFQCLHETGQKKPIDHTANNAVDPEPKKEGAAKTEDLEGDQKVLDANPFENDGGGAAPKKKIGDANPFEDAGGGGAAAPKKEEEDPFGGGDADGKKEEDPFGGAKEADDGGGAAPADDENPFG